MNRNSPKRVVVGISGASGAVLGLKALELLRQVSGVECHLVISSAGRRTLCLEIGDSAPQSARALAHVCHDVDDLAAPLASGSFGAEAMVVCPCSMRTLSAISYGLTDNLLTRAADVTLKERRRLVLVAREAPLHAGHLEAMLRATTLGAVVLPPVPAFYAKPASLDEVVTQIAARALELCGVPMGDVLVRWSGSGTVM